MARHPAEQVTPAAAGSWPKRLHEARWYLGLARVAGLDLRALAVGRVLFALLIFLSLADRLRFFSAFYTDGGVLTREEAWTGLWRVPWNGPSFLHPFYLLPDPWSMALPFALCGLAAAFLFVGWWTRTATFAAWLLLTALDNRNPLVLNAGDDVLRLLLFWCMFLPWGARWSLDARAPSSPWRTRRSNAYLSVGTFAFLVQLALIYFVSAFFKNYRYWVTEGDALHYALHLEQFVTPFGIAVRDYVPSTFMSRATWWLELVGPLLIFSPFFTAPLRYLLFVTFLGLHLGIDWTMGIDLFGYNCMAAWVMALPKGFWDRIDRWRAASVSSRVKLLEEKHPEAYAPGSPRAFNPWNAIAAFFLIYVLLWNVWSVGRDRGEVWFPYGARWLGYQLRLNQLWGMFSPGPPKESQWLELSLVNGDQSVQLWPDGREMTDKPRTPERALNERWRKFHEHVVARAPTDLDENYAEFLRRGRDGEVVILLVKRPSPGAPPGPDQLKWLVPETETASRPPRRWPNDN